MKYDSLFNVGNLDIGDSLPHVVEGDIDITKQSENEIELNSLDKNIDSHVTVVNTIVVAEEILENTADKATHVIENSDNLPEEELVKANIDLQEGLNSAIGLLNYSSIEKLHRDLGIQYSGGLNSNMFKNPLENLQDGLNGIKDVLRNIWEKIKLFYNKIMNWIHMWVKKIGMIFTDYSKRAKALKEEADKLDKNAKFNPDNLSPLAVVLTVSPDYRNKSSLLKFYDIDEKIMKLANEQIEKNKNHKTISGEIMSFYKTKVDHYYSNESGKLRDILATVTHTCLRDCIESKDEYPLTIKSKTEVYVIPTKPEGYNDEDIKKNQEILDKNRLGDAEYTKALVNLAKIDQFDYLYEVKTSKITDSNAFKDDLRHQASGSIIDNVLLPMISDIEKCQPKVKELLDKSSKIINAEYQTFNVYAQSERGNESKHNYEQLWASYREVLKQLIKQGYKRANYVRTILHSVINLPNLYIEVAKELINACKSGSTSNDDKK